MEDLELCWQRLFFGLTQAVRVKEPSEMEVGKINSLLGALNLIQPFNWNAWKEPFPAMEEIANLSLEDCIRQITRVVRADRTQEGVLFATIRSGTMARICVVAHQKSKGAPIPPLAKLSSDS